MLRAEGVNFTTLRGKQAGFTPVWQTPIKGELGVLKIRVGLVDDHAMIRSGLRQYLGEEGDMEIVGEAASGREAIDLVRTTEMDVLLMDVSMPGQTGIDALAMIRAKAPDVAILILSSYPEEHYAMSLIRQGASGYLNKQ